MNKKRFVAQFKSALNGGEAFNMRSSGWFKFVLVSDKCQIIFSFERFGNGLTIMVSQPYAPEKESMSYFLLRFLFEAKGNTSLKSPESFSEIFNNYFELLLSGNFSILSKYREIEDLFFDLYFKARKLPDADPVKIKINNFDISWMDDFIQRKS